MKILITGFCLLVSTLTLASPKVIMAPLDNLYVPKGFDNNDSVEVLVSGTFPNICYSRNTVDVQVQKEIIKVTVTAIVDAQDMGLCPVMMIPYLETVSIGNLQAGNYKIIVNEQSENALREEINIMESSSSAIDDHVYAAITQIERKGDGNEFILKGEEYSDCYKLDHFEFVDNGKDTISILPIMKKVKKYCLMKGKPTSYPVTIDFKNMLTDQPLLHVRTLDGKSINSVINFRGPLK